MKKALFVMSTLVASALVAATLIGPATAVQAGDDDPGKAAYLAAKCNMCHAVSSAGIEAKMKGKMAGPDLKGLAAGYEDGWLEKYLKKAAQLDGKDHKKAFKGTDEDLAKIVKWLEAQK